jgi:hypothetical protein
MYRGCKTRLDLLRFLRLNLINMSFNNMVLSRLTKREEIIKNKTNYVHYVISQVEEEMGRGNYKTTLESRI